IRSPSCTTSPSLTLMVTEPSDSATTGISIFIDSRMTRVSPSSTVSPLFTTTFHTFATISARISSAIAGPFRRVDYASIQPQLTGIAADLNLDDQLGKFGAQPLDQLRRRLLLSAAARDQGFDLLLDAVFAQAGRALVEVLLDQRAALVGALEIEVEIYLGQHIATGKPFFTH